MLFNSFAFVVFSLIFFCTFFSLKQKWKPVFLLIASSYFYYTFIPVYIFVLYALILIDFCSAILIEKYRKHRKGLLIISILANIGTLFFFKYYDFFASVTNEVSLTHLPYLEIVLPIGLSFHTFQSLSYIIEVYRGKFPAERNILYYSLYVMFFPQLVAGPIERPYNLLPQLKKVFSFNSENFQIGLPLILWGYFKKLVIADRLANYVDIIYQNPAGYHWLNLLIAAFFFAIQLYADFSGYSDIAIGLAKIMGIDLMINFNRPFFATNIRDLWNRWHVSLTSWFRDYLYIPLGGNRKGFALQILNLLIVFLLSGLWHGANFTFIFFGLSNGLLVCGFLLLKRIMNTNKWKTGLRALVWSVITFFLFSLTCVFFRAESVHKAFAIFSGIFRLQNPIPYTANVRLVNWDLTIVWGTAIQTIALINILILFIVEAKSGPLLYELHKRKITSILFISLLITIILFFGIFQKKTFIYFQF